MLDLDLEKVIDIYGHEEILTTRLPNSTNVGFSIKYDDLQSSIDKVRNRENQSQDEAALDAIGDGKLNLNGDLKNLGISFVEIESLKRGIDREYEYINLNVSNWYTNAEPLPNNLCDVWGEM